MIAWITRSPSPLHSVSPHQAHTEITHRSLDNINAQTLILIDVAYSSELSDSPNGSNV